MLWYLLILSFASQYPVRQFRAGKQRGLGCIQLRDEFLDDTCQELEGLRLGLLGPLYFAGWDEGEAELLEDTEDFNSPETPEFSLIVCEVFELFGVFGDGLDFGVVEQGCESRD